MKNEIEFRPWRFAMTLPDFLEQDRFGEIRLKGHRIGLYHVVFFHGRGESPEALVRRFPSLPLELVNNVIAFYRSNKDEVDAYVARCQAEIDRQRATTPEGPSLEELRRRRQAVAPESKP
jgi:uncharacterized protein (DUF433 family)